MRGPDAAGIDYPQAVAILTARGLTQEMACRVSIISSTTPSKIMSLLPFLHVYVFFYNLPLIISDVG